MLKSSHVWHATHAWATKGILCLYSNIFVPGISVSISSIYLLCLNFPKDVSALVPKAY